MNSAGRRLLLVEPRARDTGVAGLAGVAGVAGVAGLAGLAGLAGTAGPCRYAGSLLTSTIQLPSGSAT